MPDNPQSGAPNVLVIEDDSFISLFLEQKLKEKKFNPLLADTTAKARQIMEQNPIAVILLDIILPDENGFTFLEKIKKEDAYKNIPVIILSNLGQQSEIEQGKRLGALDFLVKGNYSPDEIVKRVADVIQTHRPATG